MIVTSRTWYGAAIYESRPQDIRSFTLDSAREVVEVDFASLPKQPPGQTPAEPAAADLRAINKLQKQLGEERKKALSGPLVTHDRLVPKDSSFNPESYLMYAPAYDSVSIEYADQMAEVGAVEGFRVQLMAPGGQTQIVRSKIQADDVEMIPTRVPASVWTEDYGEQTVSGGFVVPAKIERPSQVGDFIDEDRERRFKDLDTDFSQHGRVSQGNFQRLLISAGESQAKPVREAFSHIEGGNVLSGSLTSGEGYALVGQDSVAVSRGVLSEDLGRDLTDAETLAYIASDLGLETRNVHSIEQPGEFHVDMRMMCAAPGQVILNDAREAYRLQEGWLREDHLKAEPKLSDDAGFLRRMGYHVRHFVWRWQGSSLEGRLENMQEEAEERAAYEDLTAADLTRAGLRVDRMAAVFVDPRNPERDVANFVNGRSGVNEQGQRFFVGLGAEQRYEDYAAEKLLKDLPTGFHRVHFLDRDLTPSTLALSGGIKCRTKPSGTLVGAYPSQTHVVRQNSADLA